MPVRVIVAGAGIIGASIAFHLAERGAEVTVLEQARPAAGASGVSFGWINASFAETPGYYRLRRLAMERFRDLSDRLLLDGMRWNGCLWWEDEGDDFTAHAAELHERGYEAERIDAAMFAGLEPNVADPPEASIRSQIEGVADAGLVTRQLLDRAAALGARVISGCRVDGIEQAAGRVTGVRTNLGVIGADRVVLAVGAATGDVLAKHAVHVPMDNKPGILLLSAPTERLIDHIVMSPDVHVQQRADGRLLIGEIFSGGGLNAGDDPTAFAERIMQRLRRRLPGAAGVALERIMIATRPVPGDGLPVIGPIGAMPNLYVAAMHSGVTLAALVGQVVAGEVLDAAEDPLLAEFRAERFA